MILLTTAATLMVLGATLAILGVRSEWDAPDESMGVAFITFAGLVLGCLGFGTLVVDMVWRIYA